MNELDYYLIERVGATHVNINQLDTDRYYKVETHDTFCWSGDDLGWCNNGNSVDWMLKNLKPIPPRPKPEYEYELEDFGDEHWKAARMICGGDELWCKAKDDRFYKLTTQSAAVRHSQKGSLYTRKEVKRDWRDDVTGRYCELVVTYSEVHKDALYFRGAATKVEAIKLAKAILKATGAAYE